MKKTLLIICTALVLMLAASGLSGAASDEEHGGQDQTTNNLSLGLRLGFSGYIGMLGLEAQHLNFALTAGIPGSVGLKYYLRPEGHSWFVGGFYERFTVDQNDFEYIPGAGGERTWSMGGLGGGHRWFWGDGWDLSLSLAGTSVVKKETSGPLTRTTKFIGFWPGITIGRSF